MRFRQGPSKLTRTLLKKGREGVFVEGGPTDGSRMLRRRLLLSMNHTDSATTALRFVRIPSVCHNGFAEGSGVGLCGDATRRGILRPTVLRYGIRFPPASSDGDRFFLRQGVVQVFAVIGHPSYASKIPPGSYRSRQSLPHYFARRAFLLADFCRAWGANNFCGTYSCPRPPIWYKAFAKRRITPITAGLPSPRR